MKRILIALALAIVLVLAIASVASANGGPHGGYTNTTDACAGCHRTHTASAANLLNESSTYALCTSCHGNAGNGADSNVIDGVWVEGRNAADTTGDANTDDGASLLGGGFTNYGGFAVTSKHDADASTAASWGNSVARGSTGALAANLDCADCHDPHGSTNYRIIQTTVNGNGVTVTPVDEGAQSYDSESWPDDLSNLCVACHDSYHDNALAKDATSYTHNVDVAFNAGVNALAINPEATGFDKDGVGGEDIQYLPLTASNLVTCNTCHLSHGTSATMSGFALGTYDPPGALGPVPSGDSALLRANNRAVCETCHQK